LQISLGTTVSKKTILRSAKASCLSEHKLLSGAKEDGVNMNDGLGLNDSAKITNEKTINDENQEMDAVAK
jgi:hypothetical protein